MAWNGAGNFQRTNGSFSGQTVWEDDANAGFDIVDSRHDTHDQDLAQGINNCLTKDGQNSPTANLSMNTYKHTNVGDGSARNQYATVGQLQDQGVQALGLVGGTANAITASMTPTISAYVTGAQYTFKAISSNSGPATLKIDSASAVTIQSAGAALVGGEIASGQFHTVVYDGTNFQLLNPYNVSAPLWGGTTGGTSTAFTITPAPAITAYATGQRFTFKANAANGAAATLAVNGLAAKTMQRQGTALAGAEFKANDLIEVEYDGTNFQILNVPSAPLFIDRTNSRVGIGTTGPGIDLDIQRSINNKIGTSIYNSNSGSSSLTANYLGNDIGPLAAGLILNSSTNTSYGGANSLNLVNTLSAPIVIVTNNIERIRVINDGKVGIGIATPSNLLNVSGQVADTDGTGTDQGQLFIQDSDNATGGLLLGYRYQPAVTEYARIQVRNGNALAIQAGGGNVGIGLSNPSYRLQLAADSAAKPTTNTWTIASDARIKTNIKPYAKGLSDICKVQPIEYDYNGKGGLPAGPGGISIIAQDLQPIFPECVGTYKAKLNEDDEEDTDILNYNGHAITFALINSIKELNAKVEGLIARIEALEA